MNSGQLFFTRRSKLLAFQVTNFRGSLVPLSPSAVSAPPFLESWERLAFLLELSSFSMGLKNRFILCVCVSSSVTPPTAPRSLLSGRTLDFLVGSEVGKSESFFGGGGGMIGPIAENKCCCEAEPDDINGAQRVRQGLVQVTTKAPHRLRALDPTIPPQIPTIDHR